jgi:hypothetical protein
VARQGREEWEEARVVLIGFGGLLMGLYMVRFLTYGRYIGSTLVFVILDFSPCI